MAKMYPSELPQKLIDAPQFRGEVETYNALTKLPDGFEVFYNPAPDKTKTGNAFQRSADFIVTHEWRGMLAIEVKGGEIRKTPEGFQQYITLDKKWKDTDPYGQIERALREVILHIRKDNPGYWVPSNTCVIFPHTLRSTLFKRPDEIPEDTLCAEDMPTLAIDVAALFPKTTPSGWSRDAFIDLRRRLKKMRLMSNFHRLEKNKTKKSLIKKPTKQKPALVYEDKLVQKKGVTLRDIIRNQPQRPTINYEPAAVSASVQPGYIEGRSKIELREIIISVLISICVFVVILWLFPNSILHHVF